jgi:hypothetical protein
MATSVDIPVLDATELAATVVHPHGATPSDANAVAELASAGVFTLVETVPVDGGQAIPLGLDGTEPATSIGVAAGTASLEVVLTSRSTPRDLLRHEFHVNSIPKRDILDDRRSAAMIDQIVRKYWMRSVARSVLIGDGTGSNLLGITTKVGVSSIDAAAGSKVTALVAAVRAVQNTNGGFEGPHTVIAHPLALEKLFIATDWRRDRFPTVERFVPFSLMTATTVVVGAQRAASLHTTGLTVQISDDHGTNWTQGIVTIAPSAHLYLDLPFPGAYAKIVNF